MSLVVQNVQVYLEERGSGEPILFLHGVPDSADMWSGIIDRLEDRYRCLAAICGAESLTAWKTGSAAWLPICLAWAAQLRRPTSPAHWSIWPALSMSLSARSIPRYRSTWLSRTLARRMGWPGPLLTLRRSGAWLSPAASAFSLITAGIPTLACCACPLWANWRWRR